ncbi:uncharacterized protein N7506_005455 [Penicillium brevicompactum]|uniref:uncharacterized protein n=1 Tax=Penicillium brevicompactum TaxID=5074 RepID=UPI0025404980|nr:uncharacterized protein N7506_005455 [Penicillium brevicompactum]KAJ5337433.1 hypothetical protein N7506_005455 [Penicillium brevicompactum]
MSAPFLALPIDAIENGEPSGKAINKTLNANAKSATHFRNVEGHGHGIAEGPIAIPWQTPTPIPQASEPCLLFILN